MAFDKDNKVVRGRKREAREDRGVEVLDYGGCARTARSHLTTSSHGVVSHENLAREWIKARWQPQNKMQERAAQVKKK